MNKKTIISILFTIIILTSCYSEYKEYPNLIMGKWVCQEWNNGAGTNYYISPTKDAFVIDFTSAADLCYYSNTNDSSWVPSLLNYSLTDNILKVSNELNETTNLYIENLSSKELMFRNETNNVTYILYSANENNGEQLLGSWQGTYIDQTPYEFTFMTNNEVSITNNNGTQTGLYYLYSDLLILDINHHIEKWLVQLDDQKITFYRWISMPGSYNLNREHFEVEKKR